MWPNADQIKSLEALINSKGFVASLMAIIVGFVVYQLMMPLTTTMTTVPAQLNVIIAKLDQCISNGQRLASRGE